MSRMFLVMGALSMVLASLYWFTSYEDAGTILLALSAGLSLLAGAYLWVQDRRRAHLQGDSQTGGSERDEPYFPPASVWPFGIGVASFFVVNGLIIGVWFLVPGGLLLAATIGGYAAESRRR